MSRTMNCHCGETLTAGDLETLIRPILEHFTSNHPEFGLTEVNVRNYLESEDRTAGQPTDRLDTIGEVEIVPISPDRADDIVRFFDLDAFPDNHAWASCYCVSYFKEGDETLPWQENREVIRRRIETGTVTGSLAYVDGKLAGWCNATARAEIPRRSDGADTGVCSVVCFVVAPPYRQHGLQGKLLEGAIEEARSQGFQVVEGYPRQEVTEAAHNYPGSLPTYERAGFETVSGDPLVVRRAL